MEGQEIPNQAGQVDLEATEGYVRQVKAEVHRSKARVANWVALILVLGLVISLPLNVVATAWIPGEGTATHLDRVFQRWYDILAPLVGAVVGYLFGMSASERGQRETT